MNRILYRKPRGTALLVTIIMTMVFASFAVALLNQATAQGRSTFNSEAYTQALYIAEAGISDATQRLTNGLDGNIGTAVNQVKFGNGTYYTTATKNADNSITVVSRGTYDGARRAIESVLKQSTLGSSPFKWSMFGIDSVTLSSNSMTDSYDSDLGTYNSQITFGKKGKSYAAQRGNIGSNGPLISLTSSVQVHGDATPGPGGKVVIGGSATVSGSTAPAKSIEAFPTVDLPSDYQTWQNPGGTNKDFEVFGATTQNLGSGKYYFTKFSLQNQSVVNLTGPATIVCESFEMRSKCKFVVDAKSGPVMVYVKGTFFADTYTEVKSQTKSPPDLSFQFTSGPTDTVQFNSNAALYGTLYAPTANLKMYGNGELFGGIVAKTVGSYANAYFHHDEAITRIKTYYGGYITKSWREIIP